MLFIVICLYRGARWMFQSKLQGSCSGILERDIVVEFLKCIFAIWTRQAIYFHYIQGKADISKTL